MSQRATVGPSQGHRSTSASQISLPSTQEKFEGLRLAFAEANIDLWEVLFADPKVLAKQVKRSSAEIARFAAAYQHTVPPPRPIVESIITTSGNAVVDDLLNGGLRTQTLTEISGPSASGKTTLAISFSLEASKHSNVVFITTEAGNCTARMHQMLPQHPGASLNRILFQRTKSEREFRALLSLLPPADSYNLLVVDSVAQFEEPETLQLLRKLVATENIAILATNHVVSQKPTPIEELAERPQLLDLQQRWFSGWSSGQYRPKLGYTWTSLIDQRLAIDKSGRGGRKTLSVVFSPFAGPGSVDLKMTQLGLVKWETPASSPLSSPSASQVSYGSMRPSSPLSSIP